ncbi:hypothetical protein C2E23DRAFT_686247, partial [Lenzites betulinus]
LDARGIISIVVIVIYIPVLLAGVVLSMRHGFARKAGWIYLVILSIIRLIGSVTHILAEQNPTNTTYTTIYTIMEAAGTSPLLVATLGFLMTVAQYGLDQKPQLQQGHKLVSLVALIALILAIVGGTSISSAKTENDLNNANTLRHVSSALFAVVYAAVIFLTFYCWQHKKMIRTYRRKLLMGISITLPFLGVRVLEGILSAFAPLQFAVQDGHVVLAPGNTNALSKFSSQSSAWGIYLFMLVLPEYISVVIYAVVGIVTPLKKDAEDYEGG